LATTSDVPVSRLRNLSVVVTELEPLPASLLELIVFCRDYYHYPIGQIATSVLPTLLRRPRKITEHWRYGLTESGKEYRLQKALARAPLKRRILDQLWAYEHLTDEEVSSLSAHAGKSLSQLLKEGHVWREPREPLLTHAPLAAPQCLPGQVLTDQQKQSVLAIEQTFGQFSTWLLQGVTGSGKTDVYFELIARALDQQRQVMLMLPEINLTPQLEARLQSRFAGLCLASLHSGLAEGERLARWQQAARGEAHVVLGTRLAVFTPMPRLGLVIVDEEHDASFKQQDGLRYSARDLAIFLGRQRGVPVVLGSATPSLETFHNAELGRYRVARLTHRAVGAPPEIRLIDTARQKLDDGLAPETIHALRACRERGEQSLVYINRRGYAPALVCTGCGWQAGCPRCAAKLVIHLKSRVLRCHYCGHEDRLPQACPECGDQDLRPVGQGTQRVEDTLARILPGARVLRVDRDSTRNKDAWRTMREDIAAERIDVLVGTQMLAKGHDFPALTLVVVINADGALFSTDFRAAERLYATLTQVAGRAGRAQAPGQVLVQTAFPGHPLYQALVHDDFAAFARTLLDERRVAGFPPFMHQALLQAEALDERKVMSFLERAQSLARPAPPQITVYDPVPATVARIAGHSRAHILVQSRSRRALQMFLGGWVAQLSAEKPGRVRWSMDVDPAQV
jgi:primosomal protein N' (replication factor Y)